MQDKNYFNNTRIANEIYVEGDLTQEFKVMEYGKNQQNVYSCINFETADDIKGLSANITRFDLMVMDAVYTIFVGGKNKFTLEMIANVMAGKEVSLDKKTSTKLKSIKDSMDKLKKIYINIDYTQVMRETGKIGEDEEFIKNGPLMPIVTYTFISPVKHRNKTAYEVIAKPVLYEYAEALNRIVSVPTKVLAIEGIREDNDFLAIKHELVKEIEIMRNPKNNYYNREIKYEWSHGNKTGGFAKRVGLKKEQYANEVQWKKRKVKLTDQIKTVLDHLVEIQFINGYVFLKEGKSVVGVRIDV